MVTMGWIIAAGSDEFDGKDPIHYMGASHCQLTFTGYNGVWKDSTSFK